MKTEQLMESGLLNKGEAWPRAGRDNDEAVRLRGEVPGGGVLAGGLVGAGRRRRGRAGVSWLELWQAMRARR